MNPNLTVEVTNLSPKATEKDVYDFFSFSGKIDHVEIMRHGEYSSTAFVTFNEAHALDTACLLSGASIVDQPVCITRWGVYDDKSYGLWASIPWVVHHEASHEEGEGSFIPSFGVGEAGAMVKAMLSKGFVLGRDAAAKAKAFDETHGVTATAAARVADLSEKIGLSGKLSSSMEALRAREDEFHIAETTRAAVSSTGKTAAAIAGAIVNSSYFSSGALIIADAFTMAANAAGGLASRVRKEGND